MNSDVIIIGGGTAGMETAGQLAKAGCLVTLLEKENETGGHIRNWHRLFPDRRKGEEVVKYLDDLIHHENITFLKETRIESFERVKKEFIIKTSQGNKLKANAIVVATGFDLFKSREKKNMVMVFMIM